ncbi:MULTISPECIES: magnesium transporter [unclassified Brenneria]|uniref:magnesium transporter n=1 Tax=unclassified Brenneria TaxID=2634434 RepID=UPI0029C10124|nr:MULTISPECIES: magnesium transporter [unclassified Brenneria]MDX5630172.1 magnesium transporter [Brenneria sp. L3-3Z]MDX5697317.1 magnesium transporter [Brenneria sp. L4-2C]MEE3664446.1 magnesium transporter [Brenneria sp. g21c3]
MSNAKKVSALRRRISLLLLDNDDLVDDILNRHPEDTVAEHKDLLDKTAEICRLITGLHAADLADLLESLPHDERLALWRLIPIDRRGRVLIEVSDSISDDLISDMRNKDILKAVRILDVDEQAQLARILPRQLLGRILTSLEPKQRAQLRGAINYDEECVGHIMDFKLITLRPDVTLATVQRYLRYRKAIPDSTDKLFVTDRKNTLIGELSLADILLNPPGTQVDAIMNKQPMMFQPEDQAADAAGAFERYNLISAAVVDNKGRLMGRLTVEDIVDVVNKESDSNMRRSGGLTPSEDVYAPVYKAVRNRWTWLAINLCTALLASRVIGLFENTLSHLVALATLMPIVAGLGGNTGNQTITMIVRALALHQLEHGRKSYLLLKELGVAMVNGVIWGTVMGLITYALYGSLEMGGVMMLAILLNLLLAAFMGVLIPLLMVKLGRDPAVGSSVMITAITDTGGFFIFLGLATLFLLH